MQNSQVNFNKLNSKVHSNVWNIKHLIKYLRGPFKKKNGIINAADRVLYA